MANGKRIVVAGATGLIGTIVCKQLIDKGYEVIVFSRNPQTARTIVPGATEYVSWDAVEAGPWATAIDGAFGVINLAGAKFFTRWTPQYEREFRESRLYGINGLINAMTSAQTKPTVFINGSSVGVYGFANTNPTLQYTEESPTGTDDWGKDAIFYEREAAKAQALGVRVVNIRTGIVLADHDSAIQGQIPQFQNNFGGWIQPGTQGYSWIHVDDVAGLIVFALENEQVQGPLNATGPQIQSNREFFQTMGRVMHKPCWLPTPGFLLNLFLGKVAISVTHAQRVAPAKALKLGYQFKYNTSEDTLRSIIK